MVSGFYPTSYRLVADAWLHLKFLNTVFLSSNLWLKMCPNGYFVTTCSLLLSLATAAWSVDSSAAETWVSEPTARLQHPYIYFRAAAAVAPRRGEARSCASAAHSGARTVRWWMLGRMGSSKACFIQYERSNVDPKSLSLLHCCCCCCYATTRRRRRHAIATNTHEPLSSTPQNDFE